VKVGNKALQTLYIFNGIFVLAAWALIPIYALFAEEIGANLFTVSVLAAVLFASRALFVLLVRFFGDDICEKEYMLLAGFLVRALAWAALIFADSVVWLFVIQIFMGFGHAVGTPAFSALFARHLDKGREIEEFADWQIVSQLMAGVGSFTGGVVVTYFGFDTLFMIMSVLAFISFFGVLLKPRDLL